MSKNSSPSIFDLCFIGAGLSCTYTLIHLIDLLQKQSQQHTISVCIIDKANEFWTGIPYGSRSGFNSLIITSLKEFLPEAERGIFKEWLTKNFKQLSDSYLQTGGGIAAQWLKNNEALIAGKAWDKLYIPRYLFGLFLKERMTALLEFAVEKGLLKYELITAEVKDVHRNNDVFEIIGITNEKGTLCLQSKKAVLCIGSPAKQEVAVSCPETQQYICIQDMYNPQLKQNINIIYNALHAGTNTGKKNILILGSNASSLEVLYNLQNFKELESTVNKIYILSPDGMFPHRIYEDHAPSDYIPVHLSALKNKASNTCANMLEAVRKDVEIANLKNIPVTDIYESVSHVMIELLNELSIEEQEQFVYRYGVEIGKLQRRAGWEYLNTVENFISINKLQLIKGKFLKQVHQHDGRLHLDYADYSEGVHKRFPVPIDILINCTGSENLNHSSSPLVQNLIKHKICEVNGSDKGFKVDENFESCKHFFVMGPLLSGTLNSKLRIWHAESCPRIFSLAQQLAGILVND